MGAIFMILDNKEKVTIAIGILIIVLLICTMFIYMNPKDDWLYCQRQKPKWNKTDKRTDICFNELWDKYCKIRAPRQCPNQEIPQYNFTEWIS